MVRFGIAQRNTSPITMVGQASKGETEVSRSVLLGMACRAWVDAPASGDD